MTRRRMTAKLAVALLPLGLTGCELPPIDTEQVGYRGLGMVEVDHRRTMQAQLAANEVPEPLPAIPAGTPPASTIYTNLQVLGDVSLGDFNRLMAAITEWVAPEAGCVYCHVETDLASDDIYTKVVSRRMLEMTLHINANRMDHVGSTGVTCWTCHRGENVPSEVWYTPVERRRAAGLTANSGGQNRPSSVAGLTSMNNDPFTPFLTGDTDIRVQPTVALPQAPGRSIQDTEDTYALMMHVSESLGVTCTYCHNSRTFLEWGSSTPARAVAWHGIRLAREINNEFLIPLTDELPLERLGPLGDVPKVNCATCHRGLSRPLNGVSMLGDYPSLSPAATQ